jgi:hypothetical protein
MGYNTVVVVLNDALGQIRDDPAFGRKLSEAVGKHWQTRGLVDISAGNHCNAATVIDSQHADHSMCVVVGGNTGKVMPFGSERDIARYQWLRSRVSVAEDGTVTVGRPPNREWWNDTAIDRRIQVESDSTGSAA